MQVLNREGFPAFHRSLPEQALQVLLTSNLHDTFYANAERITLEAATVLKAASERHPELLARCLVYARETGSMRRLPTLGLACLSKTSPELFARVFPRVVTTPRELGHFIWFCRGAVRKGLGRSLKRAIGRFLLDLSPYHLIKYRRTLQAPLRLARPRPQTPTEALKMRLLSRGMQAATDSELAEHFPTLLAWKRFQATRDLALIESGRLPYEAVVGACRPDAGLWRAALRQMPQLALLRHLATFDRWQLLAEPDTLDYLRGRFVDRDAVYRSGVLPFRYYTAYLASRSEALRPALAAGLAASLGNLPELRGRICLTVDVSGSMSYALSKGGEMADLGDEPGVRLVDLAALLAASLARQAPDRTRVIPFDTRPHDFPLDPREDVFATLQRLAALCGGGTDLAAPLQGLHEPIDHYIGITDCEDWAGEGFLNAWHRYRSTWNPRAQAYLLTLAPGRALPAPNGEPGVHFFYGWGESVVAHLALAASGKTQLDALPER